ncbi:MAG: hypothetical protein PVF74_14270 [Anaerolineales bacterium]|jgi:hypothetical protein
MNTSISLQVDEMLKVVQQCLTNERVTDCEELDRLVSDLAKTAREAYQAQLRSECGYIVEKLETGESLTSQEYGALELLIIGEAKYYLKEENDFENWKHELKRLTSEIENLNRGDLSSIEELMQLGALCTDARRLLPGISFYLRERERVRRFEENTRKIDQSTGKFLASVIKEMLQSSDS